MAGSNQDMEHHEDKKISKDDGIASKPHVVNDPEEGNANPDSNHLPGTTTTTPSRKCRTLYGNVPPRYMEVSRSTNYVRNRNEQLKRRRELERSNSLRAQERKSQWRALEQFKYDQDRPHRDWMKESNAEAQRLRAASTTIPSKQLRTPGKTRSTSASM